VRQVRAGQFKEILEARVSPKEYRQLEKIAEHLDTTRAQLMRYMIETVVWKEYGVKE
jgi:hypothetical protein